jgi:hypothetical protein
MLVHSCHPRLGRWLRWKGSWFPGKTVDQLLPQEKNAEHGGSCYPSNGKKLKLGVLQYRLVSKKKSNILSPK